MARLRQAPRRQGGFTFLLLLWWVALSGLMLAALAQGWQTAARREREAELVWRGEAFRQAIESYASVPVAEGQARLPTRLEDLLEDRRSGTLQRHLRRIWPDPITGQTRWGLVLVGDGVAGVHSLSTASPLTAPEGVERYDAWQFVAGQPSAVSR